MKFAGYIFFKRRKITKEERKNTLKALEILEYLEITHIRDQLGEELSGGQLKILALGRLLMTAPNMILLDEPGAGVNRTLMKKMIQYIRELQKKGKTFFIIEHDMDLIMNLCDRIWVMSKGKELAEGTPAEIKKNDAVLEAYLGG